MEKFIRMFINFKGVIRLLAFIAVIMFFVPSFAVSCGGYGSISLSQANLAIGKTVQGDRTSFFVPFLLALLIPIAIIVISFLWKKENEKMMSMFSAIGGAAGFLMVFIMRVALFLYFKVNADEFYGLEIKTHFKFGAFFIILLYMGIAAISLLAMLKVIDADKCFLKEEVIQKLANSMAMQPNPQPGQPGQPQAPVPPAAPQPQVQPQAPATPQPQVQPQAPVTPQQAPAPPVTPQPPVQDAAAQTAAPVTPGVKFCSKCGNQLTAEMKFCGKCGNKCE